LTLATQTDFVKLRDIGTTPTLATILYNYLLATIDDITISSLSRLVTAISWHYRSFGGPPMVAQSQCVA
jgi:hypothetical protein